MGHGTLLLFFTFFHASRLLGLPHPLSDAMRNFPYMWLIFLGVSQFSWAREMYHKFFS